MTDNEFKYWAFLGHSHLDNHGQRPDAQEMNLLCWGDWFYAALKSFAVPAEFVGQPNGRGDIIPERIDPIFQGASALSDDAGLSAEVRQALEQSICLVVICSPRSAQSRQVNEMVRFFKQLGRGQNILPVVIAGEPYASEGNQSGRSPADECFVPALRHPVLPDGTPDFSRRAGRHVFVDARHGVEKREILAEDNRHAQADLEMAKVQLIALVIGVGFNNLWQREQKRHFFDFAEAQQQIREAQRQVREAQNKILEIQNLPPDVHNQIQEAQHQVLAAQHEAREAQHQLREFQDQVRDTQVQLEDVRKRAQDSENKFLEAQQLARETQDKFLIAENQLEEARQQARAAQNHVLEEQQPAPPETLETPNLPADVHGEIQAAQQQVLEAQNEAQQAREQLRELQAKVQAAESELAEAHERALADESKAAAAEDRLREAQDQILEMQQRSPDVDRQISAAQNEAREAQEQLWELQDKVQVAQVQLAEAQQQALADESKVLAAENLAEAAQEQLEAAQNQIRELQNTQNPQSQLEASHLQAQQAAEIKLLAAQNQIQEFQTQAQAARDQLEEIRRQAQMAQGQAAEAQAQAETARSEARILQDKIQDARIQLEAARNRALADEGKILATQNRAQTTQDQLDEAHRQIQTVQSWSLEIQNQAQAAQAEVRVFQNKIQAAQTELETARERARADEDKILAAQNLAAETQQQLTETRNQFLAAQNRIQEVENRTREAQTEIEAARNQVQKTEDKNRNARRLTQAFAILAVLGLASAGITLRHRQIASRALAQENPALVGQFAGAPVGLDQEQIRQNLQNLGGTGQSRSLDELAAWIPRSEIPGALKTSALLLNDQQRSHFQKWLLIRLGWVNPLAAMTNAGAIDGKIVNDEGLVDSNSYLQLAVLDNWMKTDLSGAFNWVYQLPDSDLQQRALEKIIPLLAAGNPQTVLSRLNDLNPAPGEPIYRLLFLRWAANDPVDAIQLRQQAPDQDQDDSILRAIMSAWVDQQPEAASSWLKSQPDSESKNKALMACIDELAKKNVPEALTLAESLPAGDERNTVTAGLFHDWTVKDPEAAKQFAGLHPEILGNDLDLPSATTPLRKATWPWTLFLPGLNLDRPAMVPVKPEILPGNTNNPALTKPPEQP